MTELFDVQRIYLFALVLARASGFVGSSPFLNEQVVPLKIRVFFLLVLSLCLFSISPPAAAQPKSLAALTMIMGTEMVFGFAMGLLARLFLLAFEMAGEIVAVQMGFGIAAVLDPLGGHRSTMIGQWMWMLGMTLFLSLGGHHLLLKAFGTSLQTCPPGQPFPLDEVVAHLALSSSQAVTVPMRLAAPVVGVLLVATLGLGILARTVPQMNVFVVGFPLKIAAGILALALSIPFLVEVAKDEMSRLAARLVQLVMAS